mmetsp:Transcript_9392/g.26141  ORF Transcript_9392/g.26141 Transcript_9392/m.26141 type:complete len:230 (+) Transcript_9392:426-1115(+)
MRISQFCARSVALLRGNAQYNPARTKMPWAYSTSIASLYVFRPNPTTAQAMAMISAPGKQIPVSSVSKACPNSSTSSQDTLDEYSIGLTPIKIMKRTAMPTTSGRAFSCDIKSPEDRELLLGEGGKNGHAKSLSVLLASERILSTFPSAFLKRDMILIDAASEEISTSVQPSRLQLQMLMTRNSSMSWSRYLHKRELIHANSSANGQTTAPINVKRTGDVTSWNASFTE